MKVLLVIPTHNESLVIASTFKTLSEFCCANLTGYDWQILVADNGSTDDTHERACELRVSCFKIQEPGRGRAIKKAWTDYPADLYVYMDADLATDLEALPRLLLALETNDLVTGSRLHPGSRVGRSGKREILSRVYNTLTRLLLHTKIQDSQCGFKGMRAEAVRMILPQVEHTGWFFDTELLVRSERAGLCVAEIPITWQEHRTPARKSTVKIFETVWDDLASIWRLRKKLPR